jgi:hypothetical protein
MRRLRGQVSIADIITIEGNMAEGTPLIQALLWVNRLITL